MFGAAIFSALAGLVLKLEYFVEKEGLKKDAAACLATLAAFLAAISTSGNFHDKWEANRIAASKVEALAFELTAHPFTPEREQSIYAALRGLVLERDLQIVREGTAKGDKGEGSAAAARKSEADGSAFTVK